MYKRFIKILRLVLWTVPFCLGMSGNGNAAYYVVDSMDFDEVIGDFHIVGEYTGAGTGQNYEVLKFDGAFSDTSTAWDGSTADPPNGIALDQAPNTNVTVSDLWTFLDAEGVASTHVFVFGFDINEPGHGPNAYEYVILEDLQITIGNHTYSLGDNRLEVRDWRGTGSNIAEAFILVELNLNFMTKYGSTTPGDLFTIRATISAARAGFEEFFLSADLTGEYPVPEPATILLLGSGLLGLLWFRKKR